MRRLPIRFVFVALLALSRSDATARPAGVSRRQAASAAERCCCGLIPRTRLNAVLSANGLP